MSQKERLEKELEQLTKTYKAGIINEKEFEKGKGRIEEKLASFAEMEKKDEEGKKIIKDILGEDVKPEKEEEKPKENDVELVVVDEKEEPEEVVEKPKKPKPKAKKPVKKKAKKVVKKEKEPEYDDEYDDEYDEEDSTFSKVIIFAGIICIILLLVLVKVFTGAPADIDRDLTGIEKTVDMEAYLDFSCDYSKDAWDVMLKLKETYGDNLAVRVKHFPMSVESLDISNAIQCARDQGRHMEYIDRIFENQEDLDANVLKNLAWAEGIDVILFYDCVDEQKHLERVKEDLKEGLDRGVRSTPIFFIDGEEVVGVQSVDFFEGMIDEKLGLI